MTEEIKQKDPTLNVREMIEESSGRLDDLRKAEIKRMDERIDDNDEKYQIQFNSAKEAVAIALIAQEKAVAAALMGQKEAVIKAELATEKRFEGVNEFRSTLADQQRTLMPRNEVDIMNKANNDRLEKLENAQLLSQGKGTGISTSWGWIVGGIAIISAVIALLLNAIRLFGVGQ